VTWSWFATSIQELRKWMKSLRSSVLAVAVARWSQNRACTQADAAVGGRTLS
jgi:hypothetical protein